MVEYRPQVLDAVFHALADPTRRRMLAELARAPRNVSELAQPFAMSLAAASKHVKVLERAGLVQRSVQGRTHLCRLQARPLHAGAEWLRHYEQFWKGRLDVLESLLREEVTCERAGRTRPRGKTKARRRA